ncbi:Tetratricopeptide repeat-containing protein [Dyadobacter soli]|uniref:Tetratricopeptide repeat-containing protein n=1 Tax=Dyadobacter soli TaxID=659014 RepID=A0A1G7UIJ1_9BACT|nr:tetratricopeptide repeat protein [Dyadobacter soli]SDG47324.1 Tetratricopeptide repeat-containing protein [Dyadobacter soli]
MTRILLLPILLIATFTSAWAQPDCASPRVQDSLFQVYAHKAHALGIDNPGWDATFDTLLAICPNVPEAYQEKGIRQMYLGDYTKMIAYIDTAVALDPKRWLAYRGYLHCMHMQDYPKAIADLSAAEQLTPNAFTMDHTFSFFIALSHMESGNYAEAEKYFLKDIAQQKRGEGRNDIHFNSLLYFGVLYYLMNEFDQAERRLNECLQLYEMHPMANYYMAMTMKITGNERQNVYFDKARQALQDGYAINEPNMLHARFPRQVTMEDVEKR